MSKAKWRNRIVGTGEEAPDQLLANPLNWRTHPGSQRKAIRGSLAEVGWVQQVIVNRTTGHVVDGHARIEEAISNGEASVPVVYVELTAEEEGLVLATLDPIGAMARQDDERLGELLSGMEQYDGLLTEMLKDLADDLPDLDDDNLYSKKVGVPQYEVTGEDVALVQLIDTTKADALRAEIDATDLPDDVKVFLKAAANRHAVFDYRRIAEYYASAPSDVQRLMERSALVIIDFDDAIANGYASFSKTISELAESDVDG